MKILTDGQVKEINLLLSDIHKADCKIDTDAIAETIRDVLRQAEVVTVKISC